MFLTFLTISNVQFRSVPFVYLLVVYAIKSPVCIIPMYWTGENKKKENTQINQCALNILNSGRTLNRRDTTSDTANIRTKLANIPINGGG